MRQMKSSGIEWIGAVPVTWEIHPIYFYFSERKNKNIFGTEHNLLSLSYGHVIRKNINTVGGLLPESFNTYNIIEANDIIIRPTDLQNDKKSLRTGLCNEHGIITSAYIALKPIAEVNVSFVQYLLHTYDIMKVFYNMGNGVRQGLNYSEFSKLMLFLPSIDEQSIIADFLDKKCVELDSLISDIQSQIEILEEYKRSVITEAVTKGLDPDVEMRDSGIDAFELIPKHWEVLKIKWLLRERNERSVLGEEEPLSMSQKFGIIPTSQMDIIPNMASSFVGAKITHIDDLVFNKLKAHLGVFAVSKYYGLVSPDYAVYFTSGKSIVKYLEFLFKTDNCISEFKRRSTGVGAGLTRLYTSDLFDIKVPIPPISEQMEIAKHLDCKISEINLAISEKQQQIETIEEYKKSLIFEYVTGKKEVTQ